MTEQMPRPGDRVRVTYDCGVVLTSRVRQAGPRLVLDIPGDNFVIRTAQGHRPPDVVELVTLPTLPTDRLATRPLPKR